MSQSGITFEIPEIAGLSAHRADFIGFAVQGSHHESDPFHIDHHLALPDVNIFNFCNPAVEGMDESIDLFLN